MLRVLQMIGALNVGGSQAMIMNIYRAIDREKIQFDFVLDRPEERYYANEVEALGGRIYTLPLFRGSNAGEVRRGWDEFLGEHPEYKILHSHVRSYASLYLPVAKKHGLKTVIHSHNTSNGSGPQALAKRALQFPLRYQADVLMACSTEAGRWLYGERACKGDRYVFLPNGVDLGRFRPDQRIRAEYRENMGLSDKRVIGHVGRMQEAKNHGFLLEAFAPAHKNDPSLRLLLVGDGGLRPALEAQAARLGIAEAVIFTGNRSDVAELMEAMDLFAFPSLWEGLPVTLVEAQGVGLPCLISHRISRDVDISPLITRLPIDSPELWAGELLKERERQDVTELVTASDFEISKSARRLTDIYEALAGDREWSRG